MCWINYHAMIIIRLWYVRVEYNCWVKTCKMFTVGSNLWPFHLISKVKFIKKHSSRLGVTTWDYFLNIAKSSPPNEMFLFLSISTVRRQFQRHILKSILAFFRGLFLLVDTWCQGCQYTAEYKISPETSWQANSGVAPNVPSVIRQQWWEKAQEK